MDELFGVTQLVQQKTADPELAGYGDRTASIDQGDKALEANDQPTQAHREHAM
jgi:hypothetical protein